MTQLTYTNNLTGSVMTALVDGFEQSLMLRGPPTTAPKIHLPWTLTGLSLTSDQTTGSFNFVDSAGKPVFTAPAPMMYGATLDPDTEVPTQQSRISATLTGNSLDLSPSMAFLTDPNTVYPVRIDPTIASVTRVGDTWVQNGLATSQVSDKRLHIGVPGAAQPTRAFVWFDTSALTGKHVTAASLKVWDNGVNTCTAATMNAYPVNTPGWDSSTIWSNQPGVNTSSTYSGSASFAHGITGCDNDYATIDVTKMTSGWASGAITNYGLRLSGAETAGSQTWTLCSMNLDTSGGQSCNTSDHYPTLSTTYDSYPNAPTNLSASPTVIGPSGKTYATSYTPTMSAAVGDADGGVVGLNFELSHDPAYSGEGTGIIWTGTKPNVTAGAVGSLQVPTGTLTAYGHEQWRVRGSVATGSGGTDYGPWSTYQLVVINVSAPAAPTISCDNYPAIVWTTVSGTGATCTFDTASPDGAGYYWSLDDPDPETLINDSSNSGAPKTTVITPADGGQHILYAKARDSALNMSGITSYTFGVGTGGILTPRAGDTTQKAVTVTSQSKSSSTTVVYKYRAGADTQPWVTIPNSDLTPPGSSTPISGPITGTVTGSNTNYPALDWNVASTLANTDGPVDIDACFSTYCSAATQITLSRSAFSDSSSTQNLGPGTVSLTTGDLSIDETDAAEAALSIGRTATSLVPAAASSGANGIFGAGWTASLPGPDAGAGEYTLKDQSANGYVSLTAADGSSLIYVNDTGSTYVGVDDADDGSSVACAAGGASCTSWTLTDVDGTVTTWAKTGTAWNVASIVEPGAESTTTYTRDTNGRVTRILAPVPTGVTCGAGTSGLVAGCSAESLTYATATTATGTTTATWGDYTGLVKSVSYTAYDPVTSAMKTVTVASYLYDNTGHLRAAWDPRISPALKTTYDYNAAGRISTDTAPGRAAWTMDYDDTGRLADVSRVDPTNGTATQAVVYDVPASGAGAPIDLSGTTSATWGQTSDLAYSGAAVFPASRVPTTDAHGDYTPATADWPYADLSYTDVAGRVVNSASYGAGDWQITSTRYDANGNTTWSLDDGNRAQALTPTSATDPYVAAQSTSAARANLLANVTTYTADGVDALSSEGPAHQVELASGALASVRVKTTTTYDQGKPTSDAYHLPTTVVTSPDVLDGTPTTSADSRTALTGYDPIDGASATGPTSGWVLKAATTSTTVMGTAPGAADIVTKTRFDSSGRAVESRMPLSSGTDAGTTITTYYTTAANASVPACGSKPQWAGAACQTAPKAQPSGTTIPSSVTTYTYLGASGTVVETSGTTTRTTTTSYDSAGRTTGSTLAVSPAVDGGTAIPATTIGYSTTTGEQTTVTTSGTTISTTTNSIGEQIQYVAGGSTMGTTYDIDGQTATRSDGKATYTYTYDGTDYAGN